MIGAPAVSDARLGRAVWAGVLLTALVFLGGLTWAKWVPYVGKAVDAARTHEWAGSDILGVGGVQAGDTPSWHAATSFFQAYAGAIWPALLVAILVSACMQAFLPRTWLSRLLNRRHAAASATAGGIAGMPSMMCACCAAPVAVTLRNSGVNRAAAVAYWLGNPVLNPAVLVFLALVAPWQWTATRLVVGIATVIGGSVLVAWIARRRDVPQPVEMAGAVASTARDEPQRAARFGRSLFRLTVVLIPEYFAVVLVIGATRGWLQALINPDHRSVLIVVVAAVTGTLMVIPTAGEIPILQALALLGASSGVLGALLITLPAVSLPGMAMVARSLGWRATLTTAAVVVAAGLVGAGAMTVL